jgi:TIGR03009 family protein
MSVLRMSPKFVVAVCLATCALFTSNFLSSSYAQNRGFQSEQGASQNRTDAKQAGVGQKPNRGVTGADTSNQQQQITPRFQSPQTDNNRSLAAGEQLPAPPGFAQLGEEHTKYLRQVLDYWEVSSGKIERYKCDFTRWVYDEGFVPLKDPKSGHIYAKTIASGVVQYEAPDKGSYETTKVWNFTGAPLKDGDEAQYGVGREELNEKWICNGVSIFEFHATEKQLIERPLPVEMQGKQIADGPLPFLFGAKADELLSRYWVRVITPEDAKQEYWLEAYPKRQEDAQNFLKVDVILDEKDFLPKAITVYEPNHKPEEEQTRKTVFEFASRTYNWRQLPEELRLFRSNFFEPKVPKGWERVVSPFGQQTAESATADASASPTQGNGKPR